VSNAASHRDSTDCTSLGGSYRCVGSHGESAPKSMELVVIGKLAGLARYVAELVISDQRGAAVVLPLTKVLRRGCCTVLYDTLECGGLSITARKCAKAGSQIHAHDVRATSMKLYERHRQGCNNCR
jgi:hypothetical protein